MCEKAALINLVFGNAENKAAMRSAGVVALADAALKRHPILQKWAEL